MGFNPYIFNITWRTAFILSSIRWLKHTTSPEGDRVNIPDVSLETGGAPPGARVKEAHRTVPPSCRQPLAIGAEGGAPDARTGQDWWMMMSCKTMGYTQPSHISHQRGFCPTVPHHPTLLTKEGSALLSQCSGGPLLQHFRR